MVNGLTLKREQLLPPSASIGTSLFAVRGQREAKRVELKVRVRRRARRLILAASGEL
ncbi:hypothetical protein [Vibrio phage vB_VpaP_C2]|nr:hypothetical protein [Vibrio phage vB_VpaP_C2]